MIGHGTIEFVPEEEKFSALKVLMNQYHAEDFKFNAPVMRGTFIRKGTHESSSRAPLRLYRSAKIIFKTLDIS